VAIWRHRVPEAGAHRDAGLVDDLIENEMLAFLPRLRRFTHGLTGSAADGDDLLQATCERAIRNIDSWKKGSRLDSWMFRIARNLHLNERRAKGVRDSHLRDVTHTQAMAFDGEAAADSRLAFDAVRGFVARLPEEQRTVLLLVAVEGLSYREAADILDIPMGTVTSRLARARATLSALAEGPSGASEALGGATS